MMKFASTIVAVSLAGACSAFAASPPIPPPASKHSAGMTCEEFLSLDSVERPKVVYWAEGLKHKGKPQNAAVDIVTTDQVVPIIVDQCTLTPHASFWEKVDASWQQLERSVKSHL
jgi:acid stress chaperone HdeA